MKISLPIKEKKARSLIIILYSVGVVGTTIPVTRDIFIFLTPFILLICFILLLLFHTGSGRIKTSLVFTFIFFAGFFVEVAGVKTGLIFGEYSYGSGLGIKFLDTPLIIGLNWAMIVYCTASILERFTSSRILKIAGASLLMTAYDFVMEQVAPVMDMWSFDGGVVPLRNYASWFALSILFHMILYMTGIRISSRIASTIFYSQLAFFAILFILFRIIR